MPLRGVRPWPPPSRAALGAFAAGMLLPLLASWISRRSDIPDQVIFLPGFRLLVPGATGLSGCRSRSAAEALASGAAIDRDNQS